MADQPDTILIVDDDAEVRALLHDQVFAPRDYRVLEAKDAPDALTLLSSEQPDLILVDLRLPGLSGHDLMFALRAQGYRGPVVAMGDHNSPRAATEALRLGATDYVTKPLREAEVLAAVERGLTEVRLRRQRAKLRRELAQTQEVLDEQANALAIVYAMGQEVVALGELDEVFDMALEGAREITGADHAFLLLRDDRSGQTILRAGHNLPLTLLDRLGEPVNDKLAELVMTSRQELVVAGDALRRFKASRDLYAAVYVPLVVRERALGVLAVGNYQQQVAFEYYHARLLRTLADYVAVALLSARLMHVAERRAQALEAARQELRERDGQYERQLRKVLAQFYQPLVAVENELARLAQSTARRAPKTSKRLGALWQYVHKLTAQIAASAQYSRRKD